MIIQGGLLYQILFNQEILVWNRLENKNQMEDSTMDKKKKKKIPTIILTCGKGT